MASQTYVPNFAQEQAYWQPRIAEIEANLSRINGVHRDNLTEDQAQVEAFAFADISKYVNEMNNNPARRSNFYCTKFFLLRASLGGNIDVKKERLSEAQKAYQRVLNAYAGDGKDEIDELGNELNKLRQELHPNLLLGYGGSGNLIDTNDEHPSEASELLDRYESER
ncbi:hypothetical protein BLS_005256 [Venturia inaequalis]|uniref:Uncharacterized protein n=1 Tax=Venturia inaequalis TaxID=5025 RepID=A0A8H3VSN1_VENIN|nr:hypothetical protein BLS_005256 [Venturia inaequalis]KAE9992842.1 hypothetical protein EG327_007612 [Venturia inaequalis]RDI77307.1 hypothetical protein Vi05172_g12737 [Venturia inaequalis]